MLAALDPFLAAENAGRKVDETRKQVENCDGTPWVSAASTETAAIQLLGDLGDRDVLNNQFHHREEELHFVGIFFQAAAFRDDARSEWRVLRDWTSSAGANSLTLHRTLLTSRRFRWFVSSGAAFPFHADQPPAPILPFTQILWVKRTITGFTDAFGIGHTNLLDNRDD